MSNSLQLSEFNALISLLDEPDEMLYTQIEKNLIQGGIPYISYLYELLLNTFDDKLYLRIQQIIRQLRINDVFEQLDIWIKEGGNNLLEAFLLVNKLDQPSLNKDKVLETIARIQQEVWLEMNDKLTALEQVALLNHILFSIHEFKGVAPNDLKPEHFSLSTVLETKIASPVAIGVLYMHIAQSLKIPLFAVNLSSNFLLAYTENYIQTQKLLPSGKVLFYLNPNKAGVLFTDEEIDLFVLHHQLPKLPSNYVPISNYLVIFRLINDLISVHVHNDNAIMLKKLLELFAE